MNQIVRPVSDDPELITDQFENSDLLPFAHDNHRLVPLAFKQVLDFTAALVLLTFGALLLLSLAIAIRLDSRGPSLFRQERVGAAARRMGNRVRWRRTTFVVYKFRTMEANADQTIHKTAVKAYATGDRLPAGDAAAPYKLTNDPRVTRLGRFLRRTSLDELPQLINVLRGEMSLVGPRPLPVYEVDEYQPWHQERLCAKPGITGLWQVHGRGRTSFDEGTAMDIDYVRRWSLRLDLSILLRTIPAVFSSRGAR